MSKTWETKKRILKLISKGTKTPGEISAALRLAPSTVSVHIKDLVDIGAIIRVDNGNVKKWKYYKIKPGFDADRALRSKPINIIPLFLASVGIVLIAGVFAFIWLSASTHPSTSLVTFRLTDPPNVPPGTEALIVSYSSLQAHIAGNSNATGWISSNATGTLDLMSLINVSEIIGNARIPSNASIDRVRFNITLARILINGKTYNVSTPNHQLTAQVSGLSAGKSHGSLSVFVDMMSTVAISHIGNSAQFTFVPSLKAIIIESDNTNANEQVGSTDQLNSSVRTELEHTGANGDNSNKGG